MKNRYASRGLAPKAAVRAHIRRLVGSWIGGLVFAANAAPAPRIVCDAPTFDFGERYADDPPVVHVFRLRNTGAATLEIRETIADCGCAASRLSAESLAPGETAELTATLNLRGRSGPQHKTLTVISNDPARPRLTLALQGRVKPEVEIRPMGALMGRIPSDRETAFDIRIEFPPERPNRVIAARADTPALSAEFREEEAGRSYAIMVRTVPPLQTARNDSRLQAWVRVKTEKPLDPEIAIPVIAHIAAPPRVLPDAVPIPSQSDRPLTRYLIVLPGDLRNPRVEISPPPRSRMRVSVRPHPHEGFQAELDGIIPAEIGAEDLIQVRIRHADGVEEFRVPFVREEAGPKSAP